MKKTLTLFFFGAMLCAFPGETEARLDFARLKDFKVKAHVNEQNAELPPGTSVRQTEDGIELNYVFPTAKHDALMIEFPMNVPDADDVTVELTAAQPGHRPYLVVVDAGEEFHYLSLIPDELISHQVIRKTGRQILTAPLPLKTRHPGEVYASHWGGDGNQRIDFPLKRMYIGLNDYPDSFQGKGKIILHSIQFTKGKRENSFHGDSVQRGF